MIDDRNRTPHTIADILCITGTGCTTTGGNDITITVVMLLLLLLLCLCTRSGVGSLLYSLGEIELKKKYMVCIFILWYFLMNNKS